LNSVLVGRSDSFGEPSLLGRKWKAIKNGTESSPYDGTNNRRTGVTECSVVQKNGDTADAGPNEDALPKRANKIP
jgi:hypothetical protein